MKIRTRMQPSKHYVNTTKAIHYGNQKVTRTALDTIKLGTQTPPVKGMDASYNNLYKHTSINHGVRIADKPPEYNSKRH